MINCRPLLRPANTLSSALRMRKPSVRSVIDSDRALDLTAGDVAAVVTEARACLRQDSIGTLRAIDQRLSTIKDFDDLRFASPDRRVRTSSEMLALNKAWGCSAIAQVACHLARATGVPCILVKSMNKSWIARKTGDGYGRGHVFVEVLIDGQRHLWSPRYGLVPGYRAGDLTVDDGDSEGPRLIYDTGAPGELVLSHEGPRWEAETKYRFP